MTEQLFATQTRLFVETSPRSGTPSGDVIEPPLTAAAVARRVTKFDEKTSPFRAKLGRFPLHEFHELRTSHEVGAEFLAFVLEPHFRLGTRLDHRSPDPTFAFEIESEDGDLVRFAGLAVRELQISFVARGVITCEIAWVVLERSELTPSLTATTRTIDTVVLGGPECDVVAKAGALVDRATDAVPARTAEIFIRRDLEAAQYGADGIPDRHNRGPWRVIGEVVTPASSFTETAAQSFSDGSAAFYLGSPGDELQILLDDTVRWLVDAEPVKADDFRDHRAIFEAEPDSAGALLTYANNV